MGYNLKNARNGKSASKLPKWPSSRPLELKSEFIRQYEFSENLGDLYGKCCWRATNIFFPYKSLYRFKNSDCHKFSFSSLMMGASDLSILMCSTCFFQFWCSVSSSPLWKNVLRDGSAAKGLLFGLWHYSRTSILRPPWGRRKVAAVEKWLLWGGGV